MTNDAHNIYSQAINRFYNDPILHYRAILTIRVIETLRKQNVFGIDNDSVVVAITLVIAEIEVPIWPKGD